MASTLITRPTMTDSTSAVTGDILNKSFFDTLYDKIDALIAGAIVFGNQIMFDGTNRRGGIAYQNSATSGLSRVSLSVGSTSSSDPSSANYNRVFTVHDAVTLADTATLDFGDSTMNGKLTIVSINDAAWADFGIRAAVSTTTVKVTESVSNIFANTTTASRIGVFWNSGTSRYRIENRMGGSRTIEFTFTGFGD